MKSSEAIAFFTKSGKLYRKTLLEDVVPFWMRHALDPESGAINNVLDDEGHLLSRDRFLWSQGRALWTFSALDKRVEQRQEWLDVANGLYRYLSSHGRDDRGRYMYRLDADGNVLERDISIYVDGFVFNGLGEYYRATGSEDAARLALDIYENTRNRLRTSDYGIAPYVLPEGMKALGIRLIFSSFFDNLGIALNRPEIRKEGYAYARELLSDFYVPEKNAVLEFVSLDGKFVNTPQTRICVPGHVIEACWFLISIFEDTNDPQLIRQCCDLIKRHLELGWDAEYGGIRLALDIEGREPVHWKNPEAKAWWVQVEALVATAYAYLHTGADWCVEWHEKVQEYCYAHYPVPTGEWTQWLDRQGHKTESAGLPVKDPFHLPRGLIYLMDLCERRIPQSPPK